MKGLQKEVVINLMQGRVSVRGGFLRTNLMELDTNTFLSSRRLSAAPDTCAYRHSSTGSPLPAAFNINGIKKIYVNNAAMCEPLVFFNKTSPVYANVCILVVSDTLPDNDEDSTLRHIVFVPHADAPRTVVRARNLKEHHPTGAMVMDGPFWLLNAAELSALLPPTDKRFDRAEPALTPWNYRLKSDSTLYIKPEARKAQMSAARPTFSLVMPDDIVREAEGFHVRVSERLDNSRRVMRVSRFIK